MHSLHLNRCHSRYVILKYHTVLSDPVKVQCVLITRDPVRLSSILPWTGFEDRFFTHFCSKFIRHQYGGFIRHFLAGNFWIEKLLY
jgi:hypothetical protein